MTPQPSPHRARRGLARRSAALVAGIVVIGGTPLVARALSEDVTTIERAAAVAAPQLERDPVPRSERQDRSTIESGAIIDADPATAAALDAASPASPAAPAARAEPAVDPVIVVLADSYDWDERSPRVALLQNTLGLAADGRYGSATQQAHRGALEFIGLPADIAPAPVLPPGPDPSEWAALRQCESGGDYTITNPSGKYRGAYQFDRPTWNSVAERHAPRLVGVDPAAASPADQDAMALALYSERGAGPWPQCGRHLS